MVAPELPRFSVYIKTRSPYNTVWVYTCWSVRAIDSDTAKAKVKGDLVGDPTVAKYKILQVEQERK